MRFSEMLDQENIPQYKLILLGLGSAGKTKLLTRYKFGVYDDIGVQTMAVDFHTITTKQAKYKYYDTAGQQRYKSIIDSYYNDCDACLIIYDTSSLKSFQQIAYYYNKVNELAPNSQIYLIGCKSDLDRKVSQDLIKKNYQMFKHFITSSKYNENITDTFKQIEYDLKKRKPINETNRSKIHRVVVNRNSHFQKEKKSKNCCLGGSNDQNQ